jgi:hypothetical protein
MRTSDMPEQTNPPDGPGNTDEHIDDWDAALEESEEDDEESTVVEEADANLKENLIDLTDES